MASADDNLAPTEIRSGQDLLPLLAHLENSEGRVSQRGAIGKYQIMPSVANGYGIDPSTLYDPKVNEQVATRLANDLWRQYHGNPRDALVAWNAGTKIANSWIASGRQGYLPDETHDFLSRATPYVMTGGKSMWPPPRTMTEMPAPLPAKPPMPGGLEYLNNARQQGASDDQIAEIKARLTQQALDKGAAPRDILKAFGEDEPDDSIVQQHIRENLLAVPSDQAPKVASDAWENIRAGFGMSNIGLTSGLPKYVTPANATMMQKMLSSTAQMAGDLPAALYGMTLGSSLGVTAGAAVPVVGETGASEVIGGVIGGGAGFNALPQAMREIQLDYLRRGEVHSFGDFMGMAGKSLINTSKAALEGAIAAPLGFGAAKLAKPLVGGALAKGVDALTQAVTYTAVGAGLEGKVPDASDFGAAAVLALGFHAIASRVPNARGEPELTRAGDLVQTNMQHIWRDLGIHPQDVWKIAEQDPVARQALMTQDVNGTPAIDMFRKYAKDEPPPYVAPGKTEVDLKATLPEEPAPVAPEPLPADASAEDISAKLRSDFFGERPDRKSSAFNIAAQWRAWVSELGPAKEIDKMLLGQGFDLKHQMGLQDAFRQTYASDARVEHFLRAGGLKVEGDKISKAEGVASYDDAAKVVKDAGGNEQDWEVYMTLQRHLALTDRGLESGVTLPPEQVQKVLDAGHGKYEQGTQMLQGLLKNVLEYGRDQKVFSQGQIDAYMKANPVYVSYRRLMGDETDGYLPSARGFKVRAPTHAFEGSDKQIVRPLLATIDNIRQIVRMADRNAALTKMMEIQKTGALDSYGLAKEKVEIADAKVAEPYKIDDPKSISPFLATRAMRSDPNPNKFLYLNQGVPEAWMAKSEALVKLIKGADSPGEMGPFLTVATKLAALDRAGVVTSPDFPTKVTWRHQITAFVLDPTHPPPFITWMGGVMDAIKQSPTYWDWVANGGAGGALVNLDKQGDLSKVFQETGTSGKIWNSVQHPIQFAQMISERMDAAARIGYYKRAIKMGYDPRKAATMGRQAYLDYAERGTAAAAQTMARITPFFRPHLLGLKQGWEAVSERPLETVLYSAGAVTMVQAALYAANYLYDEHGDLPDDQKYANLPRWEKDNYYITPPIGGVRMKLQMPPNVGIPFGGFAVRALDAMRDKDTDAFHGWAMDLLNSFVPPFVPAALRPVAEQWANKSIFTGHPLIPASLEQLSGPMQYTENTTEVAKGLALALEKAGVKVGGGLSPITIENYIRGYTGSAGMLALKALNAPYSNANKPWELSDLPFVQSFVIRNPGMSAEPIQQFFDQAAKARTDAADRAKSLERLGTGGGSAQEVQRTFGKPFQLNPDAVGADIRRQADAIQFINSMPTITKQEYDESHGKANGMTVDDKRQMTDALYSSMIVSARAGLQAMKKVQQAQ